MLENWIAAYLHQHWLTPPVNVKTFGKKIGISFRIEDMRIRLNSITTRPMCAKACQVPLVYRVLCLHSRDLELGQRENVRRLEYLLE